MASAPATLVAERFELALRLGEIGEKMLRQKLRRKHPEATEAELDAQIAKWRGSRPGAPLGDGHGRLQGHDLTTSPHDALA